MPSTLMEWPVELRLVTYNHLITSCLRHGRASDLAGLFLCCRTVYNEIQAEYIRIIAPLLLAKHKWESRLISHSATLGISHTTSLRREPRETKLRIALALHTMPEDSLVSSCLDHFAAALQPVFASHWAEVTLGFGLHRTEASDTDIRWHQQRLHGLVERLDPSVFAAPRMQRLVIDLGSVHATMHFKDYMFMLNIPNVARRMQFETRKTRRVIHRMWISRVASGPHRGWSVSIDFVPHLEPFEGALWMLRDDDAGVLRIFRLPGNTEMALDPVWLEEQYSPRLSKWGELSEL